MVEVGWRVTERDVRWLEWMGRWRFVTAPMIEREFTSRGESAPLKAIERRLRGLTTLGLVEFERLLAGLPRLYWLTLDGLRTAGLDGAVARPKLAEVMHDATVVDVAHWLTRYRVPSHTLVTEREIRRMEWGTRGEEKQAVYSLPLPERAARGRAWPDLVSVNAEGKAWGHEVEHSVKEHRRLVRLMLAYAGSDVFRGAVYYPTSEKTFASVSRAAEEANATSANRYNRRNAINVVRWPEDVPEEERDG